MRNNDDQYFDNDNSSEIPEDLGAIITLKNKRTGEEHYLWDDGEKIQEFSTLSDELKQLLGGIILRLEEIGPTRGTHWQGSTVREIH